MEHLLERSFTIPGTRFPVGLDVVLDLVPGIGTTIAAAMGAYMAGNVGFDWMLGLIPWVGAIPDLFFRSNSRNLKIIRKHLDKHHPATVTVDQADGM
jgi:hypothetical protein